MNGCQSRRASWFSILAIVFLIIMQEIPYIRRFFDTYYVMVPFILFFIASVFSIHIKFNTSNRLLYICIGIYFFFAVIYIVSGKSSIHFGNLIHALLFFLFFVASNIVRRMSRQQKKIVLSMAVFSILFTFMTNIITYYRYGPSFYHSIVENESGFVTNIVGAQYSGALMCMAGVMLICYMHDQRKGRRLIWAFIFIACSLFNFWLIQRAIVLLFSFGMYASIILLNSKHTFFVKIMFFLGICCLVAMVLNYEIVIDTFNEVFGLERIAVKLDQIKRFLATGAIEYAKGSLAARYRLYMISFETWISSFSNFLFGVGEHVDNNLIIGNHSEFIDVLAQYGIFIACSFYYAVVRSLKVTVENLPIQRTSVIYRQLLTVCTFFLLRGIVGRVVYETFAIQLFIVMPIVLDMITEGEQSS